MARVDYGGSSFTLSPTLPLTEGPGSSLHPQRGPLNPIPATLSHPQFAAAFAANPFSPRSSNFLNYCALTGMYGLELNPFCRYYYYRGKSPRAKGVCRSGSSIRVFLVPTSGVST
ncbi:hypothetical protein CEXT_363991 [Caerostris extrusa]|uniref:Uncharacterized protein n=1 Tax=Caerostris extrusa TaxID=172846 RepID=A0AAV4WMX2_CAEEX|nr:hypothetical protein CEXT_363991 [Caerostris extrusa]